MNKRFLTLVNIDSENCPFLVLKKNKITLRNSNAFRFSSKVQFLDISDNNIERLESRVFSGLGQLTLLNLTDNQIKSLNTVDNQFFYKILEDILN